MGKLVRDRIPEIIREDGGEPQTEELSEEEYEEALREKAVEEAEEFAENGSLEEAADLLEVVKSYAELEGKTLGDIEEMRAKKERERGGFKERIFLEEVI